MALLPPACETVVKVKVVANPSAQGWTHTGRRGRRLFLSKTCCKQLGCVLFGHRASLAQWQQRQRLKVERCICGWCEVWIGGLTEPSAGSRRWLHPRSSKGWRG